MKTNIMKTKKGDRKQLRQIYRHQLMWRSTRRSIQKFIQKLHRKSSEEFTREAKPKTSEYEQIPESEQNKQNLNGIQLLMT